MKKIINGRMYNTETAKMVGEWNNGRYGDFGYCSESLYQKKTGEFFLYGEGGPMSKYVVSCGSNSWGGGEMITPLNEKEAKQWSEHHITADEYENIFGEVDE